MEKPSTTKQDWRALTLGELGEVSGGGTPSTKVPTYWGGGIPWLVPSEVTKLNGLFISSTERTITDKGLADCAGKLLPPGTVLMTSRATIGEVAINTVPMVTNQGFINIRCDDRIVNNEFLARWIAQHRQIFVDRAHGVTFKEITKSNFKTIPVMLPPLPEQRAIARALRAVQEAKEARQRELALERERKAALMEFLFTHGTRGEPTKMTEIGEMPQSWRLATMGQCAELITKGSSPNWQGFEYMTNGIVFVRSQNVGWGRLELRELAHLSPDFNGKERKSVLRRGDVLINIVGASIGRAALANDSVEGGNVNQAVAIVRMRKEEFEPGFFMNFIFTVAGQEQLHRQKKDIARANLSLQDLTDYRVPLPILGEQQQIASVFSACDAKISLVEREIELLDELFRAMLEELMTGRLSAVPLIEQEAAS